MAGDTATRLDLDQRRATSALPECRGGQEAPMRDGDRQDRGGDLDLLLRWGVLVAALAIGGLLLAARAADTYTSTVGFLLTGFALLLAFRLIVRVMP
jgi:hypothetical protein